MNQATVVLRGDKLAEFAERCEKALTRMDLRIRERRERQRLELDEYLALPWWKRLLTGRPYGTFSPQSRRYWFDVNHVGIPRELSRVAVQVNELHVPADHYAMVMREGAP